MAYDETKPVPIGEAYSKARTKINWKEAPWGYRKDGVESFKSMYGRFNKLNKGTQKHIREYKFEVGRCSTIQTYIDNKDLFIAVSSPLDMPDRQRRRAMGLFQSIDLTRYSKPNDGGVGAVLAVICACAYVCKEDGCRTHPNHSDRDDRFARLLDDFGVSDDWFGKWYGRFENDVRKPGGRSEPLTDGGVYIMSGTTMGREASTKDKPKQGEPWPAPPTSSS